MGVLQNPAIAVPEQLWGLIACCREAWLPMQDSGGKEEGLII